MRTRIERKGGMLAAVLLSALALSVLFVGTAFAAPASGRASLGGALSGRDGLPSSIVRTLTASTPAAGTAGRGGVASASSAQAAGAAAPTAVAQGGVVRRPLGGRAALFGRGHVPFVAASASQVGSGWLVGGAVLAAILGGMIAFWLLTRRDRAAEMASVTSISRGRATSSTSAPEQSERKAA